MASPVNSRPHRVSLRDVAREIGVSHVTVSLALRGDVRISAQRRQEVKAVAERLGYRPDPMLSSLSAYRQSKLPATIRSTVAWINQWDDPRQLHRLREFENYWQGARDTAARLGYRLEEFVVTKDMTAARLQKILQARGVRGILMPPHTHGVNLPDFDWSRYSVVRLGVSVEHPRAHVITSDQINCASLAFSRVLERGYQRIGYVSAVRLDRNTGGNFRAGFLRSQNALVPPRQRVPPLLLELDQKSDTRSLAAFIKKHRPDAIITTEGSLPVLFNKIGKKVPGDIAVAALSVLDGNFDSGVDQNSHEIGHVAMSTLASLIQQNERGIPEYCRRILVEGRWIDGTSLPSRLVVNSKTD